MKTIKTLYMEDNDSHYKILSQVLAMTLEKDVNLEFQRVHNPEEAIEVLNGSADDYQFFVADLMFPKDPSKPKGEQIQTGLVAVEKACTYPNLAIAALSVAEQLHAGTSSAFRKVTGGTGLYFNKDALLTKAIPREELREDLLKLLNSKGLLIGAQADYDASLNWQKGLRLDLDAVIETVGNNDLLSLAKQAAPHCTYFEPSYIAPGYSGAVVIRMVGSTSPRGPIDSNALLKCSRDRTQLEIELERSPEGTEPASHIYVLPAAKRIFESRGWFATSWRFRQDAQTLLAWLTDKNRNDDELEDQKSIAAVFGRLFITGLNGDYRRGRVDESNSPIISLFPNILGRLRIKKSADELGAVIRRVLPNSNFDLGNIDHFLDDKILGGKPLSKVEVGVYECMCHGDLHSKNILITDEQAPMLIDPAGRIPFRHWASDVSRLCADLWVSSWDAGPESFVWDHTVEWMSEVKSWVEGAPLKLTITNRRTAFALMWIKDNMRKIFDGCFADEPPAWEFNLALAIEFLNLSRHGNIPAPKRCFALLAAQGMLDDLASEIPFV